MRLHIQNILKRTAGCPISFSLFINVDPAGYSYMIYQDWGTYTRTHTHIYFTFWTLTASLISLSHSDAVMALIKGHAELGHFSPLRSAHQYFTAIMSDMFYYKNALLTVL